MISTFDKVIIIKDNDDDHVVGIVFHDVRKHTKTFFQVKEMDMEEVLNLLNEGKGRLVAGRKSGKPIETIEDGVE